MLRPAHLFRTTGDRSQTNLLARVILALVFFGLVAGCASSIDDLPPSSSGRVEVEIASYEGLYEYLADHEYSQASWRAGRRDVPRVYFTQVPSRWTEIVAEGLPVEDKKQLFYLALLPLVLRTNELIQEDREFIESHYARHRFGRTIPRDDQIHLEKIAAKYRHPLEEGQILQPDDYRELMRRIDTIPPSLALGQAAYESGYGTSRFAGLGNALYGQWTWSGGMRPEQQRESLGNYGVAAFDSPLDSVIAYALNLNTNKAYKSFRLERAMLRERGKHLSGEQLASTLTSYSELGITYINTLRSIIRSHHLYQAEDAWLREMGPVHLIPASDAARG